MSVIAVVNRKGGSGKSTLATHVSAYCALRGASVAVADIDRQQSTRTWLRQRRTRVSGEGMRITAWNVDPRSFVRPPVGIDHVVIDTPGGLTGLDLARVVMYADALLVPVGASIFDRESAAACLAELRTLPRIASGRCRVAAIGMRIDAATEAAETLHGWAQELKLPIVAVLPQSHLYVRCIDSGLTLFDLSLDEMESELAHWKPLLQWLRPLVRPAANQPEPSPAQPGARASAPPIVEQPRPVASPPPVVIPLPAAAPSEQKPAPAREVAEAPAKTGFRGVIPGFLARRS